MRHQTSTSKHVFFIFMKFDTPICNLVNVTDLPYGVSISNRNPLSNQTKLMPLNNKTR